MTLRVVQTGVPPVPLTGAPSPIPNGAPPPVPNGSPALVVVGSLATTAHRGPTTPRVSWSTPGALDDGGSGGGRGRKRRVKPYGMRTGRSNPNNPWTRRRAGFRAWVNARRARRAATASPGESS